MPNHIIEINLTHASIRVIKSFQKQKHTLWSCQLGRGLWSIRHQVSSRLPIPEYWFTLWDYRILSTR